MRPKYNIEHYDLCELFYFLVSVDDKNSKKVNKRTEFFWWLRRILHEFEINIENELLTLVLSKSTCQRDVGYSDYLLVVKEQDNFQYFKMVLL